MDKKLLKHEYIISVLPECTSVDKDGVFEIRA